MILDITRIQNITCQKLYIVQHKAKCRKNVVNLKYYTYPNYNVLILYLVQHRAKCRKKVVNFKHNTYP